LATDSLLDQVSNSTSAAVESLEREQPTRETPQVEIRPSALQPTKTVALPSVERLRRHRANLPLAKTESVEEVPPPEKPTVVPPKKTRGRVQFTILQNRRVESPDSLESPMAMSSTDVIESFGEMLDLKKQPSHEKPPVVPATKSPTSKKSGSPPSTLNSKPGTIPKPLPSTASSRYGISIVGWVALAFGALGAVLIVLMAPSWI
jgi:hypothetical protein